jgi:mRNA interferase MazF
MVGAKRMTYQWKIFLASLDPAKGSEQAGDRPVLIISREEINQLLSVVNVIPLTSHKSPERVIYPNEVLLPNSVTGLRVDSIALCFQIRTLDKKRLHREMGKIEDQTLQQSIHQALRFQLDLSSSNTSMTLHTLSR